MECEGAGRGWQASRPGRAGNRRVMGSMHMHGRGWIALMRRKLAWSGAGRRVGARCGERARRDGARGREAGRGEEGWTAREAGPE